MKKILTILLIASAYQATLAFSGEFPELSPVKNETYQCLMKGGGWAIKTTNPQKIWQVDVNKGEMSKEGLLLSDVQIKPFRCPDCYKFEAKLEIGENVMDYVGSINRTDKGVQLRLTMKESNSNDPGETVTADCTLVGKN